MKEMYHRKESRLTPAKPADGDDKRSDRLRILSRLLFIDSYHPHRSLHALDVVGSPVEELHE